MNKKLLILPLLFILLITGCASKQQAASNEVDTSEPAQKKIVENVEQTENEEDKQIKKQAITLDTPIIEGNEVRFHWQIDPMDDDYNKDPNSWRLFRSTKSDAEYDKNVYWYRSVIKYNFNGISDLPNGTHYFRVCLFKGWEDGYCTLYSNTVKVEIP